MCRSENQSKKPTIITEPFDIETYEGTVIELPCESDGEPEPEVRRISVETVERVFNLLF